MMYSIRPARLLVHKFTSLPQMSRRSRRKRSARRDPVHEVDLCEFWQERKGTAPNVSGGDEWQKDAIIYAPLASIAAPILDYITTTPYDITLSCSSMPDMISLDHKFKGLVHKLVIIQGRDKQWTTRKLIWGVDEKEVGKSWVEMKIYDSLGGLFKGPMTATGDAVCETQVLADNFLPTNVHKNARIVGGPRNMPKPQQPNLHDYGVGTLAVAWYLLAGEETPEIFRAQLRRSPRCRGGSRMALASISPATSGQPQRPRLLSRPRTSNDTRCC